MPTDSDDQLRPADPVPGSRADPPARGQIAVCLVADSQADEVLACLRAVLSHTAPEIPVVIASPSDWPQADALSTALAKRAAGERRVTVIGGNGTTAAVNAALRTLSPADVVVLSAPCRVAGGWLPALRAAGASDSGCATASALATHATALSIETGTVDEGQFERRAERLLTHSSRARPRLIRAVGPCILVRRHGLELAGQLDESLELPDALEVDFAQRCVLRGLSHVAADDVLVSPLLEEAPIQGVSGQMSARYPHLSGHIEREASAALSDVLRVAAEPPKRLSVTVDARAVGPAMTGTQVHILELIDAIAQTGRVGLRVLLAHDAGLEARERLGSLPDTELLDAEEISSDTPRTAVVHRPQQVFSAADLNVALELGERVVISQLDLIAYRNPAYFAHVEDWRGYRRVSRQALAVADRVVVFSDHTRSDLLAEALVEPDRIRRVPPGIDHAHSSDEHPPQQLHSLAEGGTAFLVCLGTDFMHKNRPFALEVFGHLRAGGWDGRLVLAGPHMRHGSSRVEERAFLESHPQLRDVVTDIPPVSEAEKRWLLRHAQAVLYPSTYEGFGLVPFESALLGTPCLFAPQTSLAELLPGIETLEAWNVQSSAARVMELLEDPDARDRHVRAILAAGERLTWAQTADAVIDIYEEADRAPAREATALGRDSVGRERDLLAERARHAHLRLGLLEEREEARRAYFTLRRQVGESAGLIGPDGWLAQDLQRALLAISARPLLRRAVFGAMAGLLGPPYRLYRRLSR